MPRTSLAVTLALVLAACTGESPSPGGSGASAGAPSGDPIVVGSTLSLSGAFAATGAIHQLAGKQFVEQLNANGGLLGRPVKWMVLDDESDQAQVSTLYERLISQEQVDLIMGPYATPNILAAMAVAERNGYVLPQHTSVLAPLMTYECQFPGWSIGPAPNEYVPNMLFDALESLPDPPKTIAIITNQNGSTDFISRGLPDDEADPGAISIAEERGLEVVLELPYPPGNTEWGSIAAEIRDADPDVVMNNGLGVDPVGLIEAMQQLDFQPPHLFSLFPAPGPPLGLAKAADGMLSVSIFEGTDAAVEAAGDEVRGIVEEFEANAADAGVPYTAFETQAAASWNAWEILVQGVEGAGDLEHEAICSHLRDNGADLTFAGHVDFPSDTNNFWPSNQGIKQIQDGKWVMVWPEEVATADLQGPSN
jgi:branched-chain amino acid transport system substrate-binding protein